MKLAEIVRMLEIIEASSPEELARKEIFSDDLADAAIKLLQAASYSRSKDATDVQDFMPVVPVSADDYDRRWKLHVAACSIEDMTFWVEKKSNQYFATEVETGVTGAASDTARGAMENYWQSIH